MAIYTRYNFFFVNRRSYPVYIMVPRKKNSRSRVWMYFCHCRRQLVVCVGGQRTLNASSTPKRFIFSAVWVRHSQKPRNYHQHSVTHSSSKQQHSSFRSDSSCNSNINGEMRQTVLPWPQAARQLCTSQVPTTVFFKIETVLWVNKYCMWYWLDTVIWPDEAGGGARAG